MSRLYIGTFEGSHVYEGKCETCGQTTRIVWNEELRRYMCGTCLEVKDAPTKGHAYHLDPSQPFPTTLDHGSKVNVKLPVEIMVNS
jgi:hypothetical protein